MATSFTVNQADLAFMLKQIKLAEMTSAAYTPTPTTILQAIMTTYGVSAADAAILPFGLRTVDGSFNNLLASQAALGAADTLFPRLTDPVFINEADGDTMPLGPPGGPVVTNTNYDPRLGVNPAGVNPDSVADADPRIISNLIVDMSTSNPAAVDAWFNNPLSLAAFEAAYPGITPLRPGQTAVAGVSQVITNEDLATLPNQSPDIGLSPGFNSWMTFFGQFFDHGLDLVTKGNAGTVYIPLQPDDPLYVPGGNANFMVLTRATVTLDANGIPQHENTTTSFIDQNQTYTSHPSHQVFLRDYVRVGSETVATGRLLDGSAAGGSKAGAVGNWGEVKAQALTMLGIRLNDFDVHNVPLLLTDAYGKFIPGVNGYAQLVMAPDATHATNWLKEGTAAGITTAGSLGTNHAFLNDIAHHATPGLYDSNNDGIKDAQQTADTLAGVGDDGLASTYDDEMLNAHFVTGDGRGNENIALTAVHSVFHSEHNRLVEANKATILATAATGDYSFLNEWLVVDLAAGAPVPTSAAALVWDGERLFQAARFATEMQYQHLVFEEFARRIQPAVDPFVFNNSPNIDPAIVAEFAHTVYRFGHSMLTGTVDRLDNKLATVNGEASQQTLLAAFLNPQMYLEGGATVEEINANLVRGLSRDVGNEMDEFIVADVRSNLLGLPLDLAALNIARGRETGIPSLNETRAQLYNGGAVDLKPYTSWADFAEHIKNPLSIVNFMAAYGTHASIASQTTTAGMRTAAEALVNLAISAGSSAAQLDARAFVNGTGNYAGDLGGLNRVDLWIGGLAEIKNEFGGMLGQTFNYIFEYQMEQLQSGDRLYYLSRTQGTNLLNNLEPNTFSDLVMRNTALGDIYSTHLSGALFITPDHILELDRGIAQQNDDPTWAPGEPHSIFATKVTRTYSGVQVPDANGVMHDVGGTLKFLGGEHVVLGGTEGNDRLLSDIGDDTLWGDGGNDYLNGATGADDVFGGDGDDIIEDPFGDDVLRGNAGNDVIATARGIDLVFGDAGIDYLMLGQDASEIFGGTGDDFILGSSGGDFLLGNEGNDWMEGGAGFDTLAGDNSELFFNSPIIGHDVLFSQGDEGDLDAESGDDIMGSSASVLRYEGMFGFDWGIAKHDRAAVDFDLAFGQAVQLPVGANVLRDRFDLVEALSGWTFNDTLSGDNRGSPVVAAAAVAGDPLAFTDHVLNAEGITRITGMREWLGVGASNALTTLNTLEGTTSTLLDGTNFANGNILMGGDGNDLIKGLGGNDIIDGDAWLNVRIRIVIPAGQPNAGTYSAESMNSDTTVMGPNAGKVFNVFTTGPNAGQPNFASPAFGGASLTSLMLAGTINPGALSIVRELSFDDTNATGAAANLDTAVFQGNYAEYDIEGRTTTGPDGSGAVIRSSFDVNGDGFIAVTDRDDGVTGATVGGVTLLTRRLLTDGTDLLKNIERLQFADQAIRIGVEAPTDIQWNGVVPGISDLPAAGAVIANLATVDQDTLAPGFTYTLVSQTGATGSFTVSTAGVVTRTGGPMLINSTYTLTVLSTDDAGLSFTETFTIRTDSDGNTNLSALATATDDIIYADDGNDIAAGGDGNDTLFGMNGNDTLDGGLGNDVLNGGAGGLDTASYASAAAAVTVSLALTTQQNTLGAGLDTLVDIENLTGSALNDTLGGNASANLINGGIGADAMTGGDGSDTFVVDNAGDTVVESAADGDTDAVQTSLLTYTLADNVESLGILAGSAGNRVWTGNAIDNTITSNGGADTLNGGDGNDTLSGNGGADTINGGNGNDTINGGAQADILIGGAGADTINMGGVELLAFDAVRFTAAGDYGDTILNFDANGVPLLGLLRDQVQFSDSLNTLFDDGTNDDNISFVTSGAANNSNTAVNLNGVNEALFLTGAVNDGVTTANLGIAAAVATEFNAEFAITAANGEATLLVINDTNGNSAAMWQWVQNTTAAGQTAEIDVGELTLIGVINANATVATASFDFV